MKKAFVILAHQFSDHLFWLIDVLQEDGSYVALHFDRDSYDDEIPRAISELAENNPRLVLAESVPVSWGEWSIVRATLNALESLHKTNQVFDYVSLLSGACVVTKPLGLLDRYLEAHQGKEFIESFDGHRYRWVRAGYQEERWRYYHFLNWREHPRLFDSAISLQHYLGVRRRLPSGLTPRMGSQWWTLSWETVVKVLDFTSENRLERFFRHTWVPDELFFQTLVPALVDCPSSISGYSLMQYDFVFGGTPRVYYDDNILELLASEKFFARKISADARLVRKEMSKVSAMPVSSFIEYLSVSGEASPEPLLPPTDALQRGSFQFRESPLSNMPQRASKADSSAPRYFVVVSFFEDRLQSLRERLNASAELECQGHLMANSLEQVAAVIESGSSKLEEQSTLTQRDRDRLGFLQRSLSLRQGKMAGFIVNPVTDYAGRELLEGLMQRPDFLIILDQEWCGFGQERVCNDAIDLLVSSGASAGRPAKSAKIEQYQLIQKQNMMSNILGELRRLHGLLIDYRANYLLVDPGPLDDWTPHSLLTWNESAS